MSYVVNRHLDNLYVLANKAVGPGKKSKINKCRAYIYSGVQSRPKSAYVEIPLVKPHYEGTRCCCIVHSIDHFGLNVLAKT